MSHDYAIKGTCVDRTSIVEYLSYAAPDSKVKCFNETVSDDAQNSADITDSAMLEREFRKHCHSFQFQLL